MANKFSGRIFLFFALTTACSGASAALSAPLVLSWSDSTPGNSEIFVKTSLDNGLTWPAPKRLTYNAGYSSNPDVAVSGSNVHVLWHDDTTGNQELYYRNSADNGITWSTSRRLTNNSGMSSDPSVAAFGSNVHVAWWDNTSGNNEIYFKTSPDDGATWSAAKRLTSNGGDSVYPSLSANGSTVHVAWFDSTPGNFEVFYKVSTDNGSAWSPAKRLTHTSASSYHPSITSNGTNVYLTWRDRTPGNFEIYFRMSPDNGITWAAPKRLTNNSGNSHSPSIASVGSDIYITWFDDSTGNEEIYFKSSSDMGTTWSATKRLSSNAGYSIYPSVAASGSAIQVTWSDSSSGNWEIYLRTSTDKGLTWNAIKKMTNNTGDSTGPVIAR